MRAESRRKADALPVSGGMRWSVYALANIYAGIRRGRLAATIGVGNVFDRTYAEHLSYQRDPFRSGVRVNEPGRNAFGSVSWRF